MKILQIIDKLNIGGAERVLVDMTNILHANGMEIGVMSLLDKGMLYKEIDKDIPQYILNRKGRFSLRTMREFVSIANEYEVLHIHMRHNLRYVVLCKLLFGLKGKIVFQDHTGVLEVELSTKICFKMIDMYIGVCNKNIEEFVKNGIIYDDKACLLRNIVRYIPASENIVRENRIVMVGNIREEKNYLFAFDFLKSVDKEVDVYGNYVSAFYKKQIDEMKSDKIRVIEGESRVQQFLSRYRMALHVSPSETGPLVLIEYLAHGVPFLTYNTGEVVSQIREELPEFIVDVWDIEEWVKRIDELDKLIDEQGDDLRVKMRVVFSKYYSEKTYFEKCKEIYANVLSC